MTSECRLGSLPLIVRAAQLRNIAQAARLEERVWRDLAAPYRELRRRFILFPKGFQVALALPQLVGFCCALRTNQDARLISVDESFPLRHATTGDCLFIFSLTVDPTARLRRVGTRLVEQELAVARELGCRRAQVVANAYSAPLFLTLGFEVVRPLDYLFHNHRGLMPDPVLLDFGLSAQSE
jgi:GNAT superfamily N-acetyltransferase